MSSSSSAPDPLPAQRGSLEARLSAAVEGGHGALSQAQYDRLLTDGCAAAHQLERHCVRLARRERAIISGRQDADALASLRREDTALRRELDRLRLRLAQLRAQAPARRRAR